MNYLKSISVLSGLLFSLGAVFFLALLPLQKLMPIDNLKMITITPSVTKNVQLPWLVSLVVLLAWHLC